MENQSKINQTNLNLETANKYIFVQDFRKAEEILRNIAKSELANFEAYFRWVEIALRNHNIDQLILEIADLYAQNSNSEAAQLSLLLAKVKKYALEHKDAKENIPNPGIDILFSHYEKVVRLPNKKLKVHRSSLFPDDVVPALPYSHHLETHDHSEEYLLDLLGEIQTFTTKNPENYAGYYALGCVLDTIYKTEEAIGYWKKALRLNPHSMCTLSVLAELQINGLIRDMNEDYSAKLESLDRYLVHGHLETHTDLYNEFIEHADYKNAIASLRILSDWIFRQFGSVPIDIEAVCLLGSMSAYKLDNNMVAAESCRNQVENLVIAYKKSTDDLKHLVFLAELCEEYELSHLAKICYFTVLTAPQAEIEILKQVAGHCVNYYPSEALLVNLRLAYERSHGHPEIRFCILVCSLHLKGIDIVQYMENKNNLRSLIQGNKSQEALLLLEKLEEQFSEDPEIQYYLAEINSRKHKIKEAFIHFEKMFSLDAFNQEASLKYIYFLLRNQFYSNAIEISKHVIANTEFQDHIVNDVRWSMAAAYFANEKYDEAQEEILKSLESDPWNIGYISLHIRCALHLLGQEAPIPEASSILSNLDEFSLNPERFDEERKAIFAQLLADYSQFCIRKGFYELAWAFVKSSFCVLERLSHKVSDVLSRSAAAYLPQKTIPEIIILLKKQSRSEVNFAEISSCIAKTYGYTGKWEMVDEWLSMAQNHPFINKLSKSKLFELEALSMAMQGSNFKKAQNLLEAAFDGYETHEQVPFESKILHGYLLVAQGKIADGIERMQKSLTEHASIQSLYFFIKGMERAGILSALPKESLEQMKHIYPSNHLEQKMIEEIFCTVSSKLDLQTIGLAC